MKAKKTSRRKVSKQAEHVTPKFTPPKLSRWTRFMLWTGIVFVREDNRVKTLVLHPLTPIFFVIWCVWDIITALYGCLRNIWVHGIRQMDMVNHRMSLLKGLTLAVLLGVEVAAIIGYFAEGI